MLSQARSFIANFSQITAQMMIVICHVTYQLEEKIGKTFRVWPTFQQQKILYFILLNEITTYCKAYSCIFYFML